MNNCFSICPRSDLNRIRKETMKKRLVWLKGEFLREHVAVNSRCITTVFSNMANHSFNCFVNFSINDWKENVESLNNSAFWEETQSFIASVNSPWMRQFCRFLQMLLTATTIEVSVFLAMLTCWHVHLLKIFAFLFFFVNWPLFPGKVGLARKSRVHKTVTKRPSFPLWWSIKTLLRACESQLQ